ncbi:MAG: restriction endonuclease subunit S [Paludibacteraceae bacterium]|nr:restriction endonuclease subunit S [Paludibacteraceae bacterium]
MSEVVLNDICDLIVDCPHSTAYDEGTGYPLVRTPNIGRGRLIYSGMHRVCEDVYNKRNARAIPQTNDLIFAREATAGNVALIQEGEKVCLGQRTVLIRPNANLVNPAFLTYHLLAPEQQYKLLSTANGATVAHVNMPTIRNLKLSLPPLPTQHRIATILSRYDSLIENYQKQIKLLEEAAQRLYKEWFIDLHFPGHENTTIIDGVPEGWEKKSVTDVLEIKYGKDHKLLKDGTIPVYGTGGVMRYVEKNLYTGESVLIPRKGSLNNILLVNGTFWTIDTMFYSIPKEDNVAKIVYFFLKGVDMYSFNIGAAVPSMTVNILSGMKLLIPNSNTRKEFENIVSTFYNRIQSLQSQLHLLTEARDRLLPKLMSGEIEV